MSKRLEIQEFVKKIVLIIDGPSYIRLSEIKTHDNIKMGVVISYRVDDVISSKGFS